MTLCDVIETFVVFSAVFPCPPVVKAQNARHDHYSVMLLILRFGQSMVWYGMVWYGMVW